MEIGAVREFIMLLWRKHQGEKDRRVKSRITDAVELTLGCHRKSVIRLLGSSRIDQEYVLSS